MEVTAKGSPGAGLGEESGHPAVVELLEDR